MRLFIAVLPDERFRASVNELLIECRKNAESGSFVRPENIHLTMLFIGESDKAAAIKAAMNEITVTPFEIELATAGSFKRGDGHIVWAGISENCQINKLYDELCANISAAGVAFDKRGFKPHITVGRRVELPRGMRAADFNVTKSTMTVKKVSLMKSEQVAGKLTYTEIYSKELGA